MSPSDPSCSSPNRWSEPWKPSRIFRVGGTSLHKGSLAPPSASAAPPSDPPASQSSPGPTRRFPATPARHSAHSASKATVSCSWITTWSTFDRPFRGIVPTGGRRKTRRSLTPQSLGRMWISRNSGDPSGAPSSCGASCSRSLAEYGSRRSIVSPTPLPRALT